MQFVVRDNTGYSIVATFETQEAADRYLRGVARHNADFPEEAVSVSTAARELRPVYSGGAPRGYGSTAAFIRR